MGGTGPRCRRAAATLLPVFALVASLTPLVPARAGPPAPALSWLRVDPNTALLRNNENAEVLLRGTNVNQLGDYYAAAPTLPTVEPLSEDDFAQIASLGFNTVRLIISWSSLEPARGTISQAYLSRVHQAVKLAAAHGVYVVLDMHQDAWGKYVATPPGVTCPPGLQPAIGWDGAPAWATITDGLTTCREQLRELSPAVGEAWQNFYVDRSGIQTELVRTWAAVAASFAADPTIAGYDLLNEPNPGLIPFVGPTDTDWLGRFYARAIDAIRAAEGSVAGGRRHIVFFEPTVTWDLTGGGLAPRPGFTSDDDIAFAPHLYNGSLSVDASTGLPRIFGIEEGFKAAELVAGMYPAPLWTGEWGWFGDPAAQAADVATFAKDEDAASIGGAWWDWKQACGDPHQIGSPGAPPGAIADGLNRYSCPSGVSLGRPRQFTDTLSRAFPRAVVGSVTGLTSDPATGTLVLRGRTLAVGSGTAELWIPTGRWGTAPPSVSGYGIGPATLRPVSGGWIADIPVLTILGRGGFPYTIVVSR